MYSSGYERESKTVQLPFQPDHETPTLLSVEDHSQLKPTIKYDCSISGTGLNHVVSPAMTPRRLLETMFGVSKYLSFEALTDTHCLLSKLLRYTRSLG